MNIHTLAMVTSIAALAACAQQAYWVKVGATDTDFARDSYLCKRDALAAYPERVYPRSTYKCTSSFCWDGRSYTDSQNRTKMETLCLRAFGWRLVSKP